ncbi:hypothetical protein [Demequina litorisediminis]|uniref:HNH endonuclease n=1 Tax=Demequina litorisediminis TaxID=1849022 RepID=A0ABQ6I9F2_9MICO|nr:hypothetical protein [Demequina litorisediminis]GMA34434.1 hypothetical protein GCM10025876_06380 [Demequina litorisediminis]
MGTINRDWHQDHRMPAKPSEDERGQWHWAHQEHCGCRAPSAKEQALIDQWRATHAEPR